MADCCLLSIIGSVCSDITIRDERLCLGLEGEQFHVFCSKFVTFLVVPLKAYLEKKNLLFCYDHLLS